MTQNAAPLASKVSAITLFVSDLGRASAFYECFLRSRPVFKDDDETAYQISDTVINLNKYEAVPELVRPREMAREGLRAVYTLPVPDVDTAIAALADADIAPISGPMDRPWGSERQMSSIRMAVFGSYVASSRQRLLAQH